MSVIQTAHWSPLPFPYSSSASRGMELTNKQLGHTKEQKRSDAQGLTVIRAWNVSCLMQWDWYPMQQHDSEGIWATAASVFLPALVCVPHTQPMWCSQHTTNTEQWFPASCQVVPMVLHQSMQHISLDLELAQLGVVGAGACTQPSSATQLCCH